ncbi:GumC family protein [Zavarzinia sp. CC-PAN008]|uniref:GumC family protein n=1 Tax=Zavarzinia sp. CC-PAN008 TaxID=3243332 RepID=UPI003F746D35
MSDFSLRAILTILFRYRVRVVAAFLLVVAIALFAAFAMTPMYEASASVTIRIGRETVYRPEVGNATPPQIFVEQEQIINTQIQLLQSRDLAERAIAEIGLARLYPDLADEAPEPVPAAEDAVANPAATRATEQAVRQFQQAFWVVPARRSNVVQMGFEHRDPVVARDVVATMIDNFKDKIVEVYGEQNLDFLVQQTQTARQELDEAEQTLAAFREEFRIYDYQAEIDLLLKQRMDIDSNLKASEANAAETERRVQSLSDRLAKLSPNVSQYTETEQRSPALDTAQGRLLELRQRERELLARFQEASPPVSEVRQQIQETESFLGTLRAQGGGRSRVGQNDTYVRTQQLLIEAEAQLAAVRAARVENLAQIETINQRINALSQRDGELKALSLQRDAKEASFTSLQTRLEEARTLSALDREKIVSIGVVTPPAASDRPVRPNRTLYLMLGLIVGVISGIGTGLLSGYLSQRLTTPEQAEAVLGLPVLASLPLQKA